MKTLLYILEISNVIIFLLFVYYHSKKKAYYNAFKNCSSELKEMKLYFFENFKKYHQLCKSWALLLGTNLFLLFLVYVNYFLTKF